MCGEKYKVPVVAGFVKGSPPHVRGKARGVCLGAVEDRITPACAGKSDGKAPDAKEPMDHPRMCGEKAKARATMADGSGSPPHVRGKGSSRP